MKEAEAGERAEEDERGDCGGDCGVPVLLARARKPPGTAIGLVDIALLIDYEVEVEGDEKTKFRRAAKEVKQHHTYETNEKS